MLPYVFVVSVLALYALAFNFEAVANFVRRRTRQLVPVLAYSISSRRPQPGCEKIRSH